MADAAKQTFWNGVAPLTFNDGGAIPGVIIKAGQEVAYSKIIRKMFRSDNKSWWHLVIFSLLTSVTDPGLGGWYGDKTAATEAGFMEVLQEAVRPLLSCLWINYLMATSGMGIHNPMRSFSFKELLIQLAAKDAATGGNAIISQNFGETLRDKIRAFEQYETAAHTASRFKMAERR